MALAGADGAKLAGLLKASKDAGVKLMAELVAGAVKRYRGRGLLLTEPEVQRLSHSLAAVNATADLFGRARVRELSDRAIVWEGSEAPPDVPFQSFAAEPVGVIATPEAALNYFTRLRPELGVDPERFAGEQRRRAFTLAASTNKVLTERVQKLIADSLKGIDSAEEATASVRRALEAAGVAPSNPQYSEMVYRTNAMDSYQTGAYEEGTHPDVSDLFPCWQYVGIADGRQGADHAPKFDRYYPRAAAFADVRGNRPYNCRCSLRWVDADEWERLESQGARVEDKW